MDILPIQNLARPLIGLVLLFFSQMPMASVVLPEPLDAETLADLVVERNPGVAALEAALQAANSAIEPAGALDDPMLSYTIAPETIGSEMGDRHSVAFSQALPWPGVLEQRTAIAQSERDAASESMAGLKLQVRSAALSAYANWYFVHRSLAFNAANQQLMSELISVAATTYSAGRGAQQDVVGAQLRQVELAQEALLLQRQRSEVAAQLRGLLAVDASVVIPPPGSAGQAVDMPDEASLVAQAMQNNPRLKSMRHQLQAFASRVNLAEKDFYPNFKLNAAYLGTMDPREKRSQLGVAINLPLNRSRRRAEVDRRQAEQLAWQFRIDDEIALLRSRLGELHARWQQSQQTVQLLQDQLIPLAEQNLSATRSDYGSGNGDFRAVIDAETRLLKTETMLARSQADRWVAQAEIERLAGGRLGNNHE